MNELNTQTKVQADTQQVNEARAKLETLHNRRAEIEAQRADAQSALEVAQRGAIDGSATTAQLGKAREKIETLNDLWDALEKALESAQGEFDRVAADARHETALQALHSACAGHLAIHREKVVMACEKANALWVQADAQISDAENQRETAHNEARRAFDELCPDVLNRSVFRPPTEERQALALSLVATMKAAGIDTSALRSDGEQSHNDWLNSQLGQTPDNGLIPALKDARRTAKD